MSKSRPDSRSKARKRSLAKGKLEAKASMEERKSFSQFVLEFLLLLLAGLRELGRKLFSLGSSEENKEPSLSLESPDAAPSSSALATPSGTSVAAKRASGEQTEGPAVQRIIFGTYNDEDPCDDPNSTGHSKEAWKPDPEVFEAVFSSNGVMVGEIKCPYEAVCRRSNANLPRVIEDEIKFERPGSGSGYLKEENGDLKKEIGVLKKKSEDLELNLQLREIVRSFNKKSEGKSRDYRLKKEVLKLLEAKSENIDMIISKGSYSNILRMMFFQGANMNLESNFSSSDWRDRHRFPKFSNGDADYQFWKENFDPEILERRLGIFREAAKNLDPVLDMFKIIELVSKLNSKLHPQPRENECNETEEDKMSRLLALLSGGNSKS